MFLILYNEFNFDTKLNLSKVDRNKKIYITTIILLHFPNIFFTKPWITMELSGFEHWAYSFETEDVTSEPLVFEHCSAVFIAYSLSTFP